MENYEFHPLSALFPLMNQEGVRELGLDMKHNGQEEAIVLFEGKILDGRNRYLACRMFNLIPRFEKLKEGLDPLTFILSKNLYRRHLNTAQRCEIGLKLLKIERKRAKARQIGTQFNGRTKNNVPKYKASVSTNLLPTDNNQVKGRAVNITAKKVDVSPTTLRKTIKIDKVAKHDPEIKKKWNKVKASEDDNKISIEKIYQEIKEKENHNASKEKASKLNSKVVKKCEQCSKAEVRYCLGCNLKFIICRRSGNLPFKKIDAKACKDFEEP